MKGRKAGAGVESLPVLALGGTMAWDRRLSTGCGIGGIRDRTESQEPELEALDPLPAWAL